jgi:hypothetical protein
MAQVGAALRRPARRRARFAGVQVDYFAGAGEEVEQALGRVGTETHLEDPFWHICTTLDISTQITEPEVARMVSQVTNRILA